MIRSALPLLTVLAACAPTAEAPTPAPASAPGGPAAGVVAGPALLRRWVSMDDPARAITIDRSVDGYTFGTQTNGLTDTVEPMRFVADCDARAPADVGSGTFTVGADGALCYRILSLTPGGLVLSSPPRGDALRYAPG